MPKNKHKLSKCLNCNFPFKNAVYDNYCPNCGQKNSDNKFSLFEVIQEFSSQLLAFDSKFLRSISKLIFQPGNLSINFNNGHRIRYTNPGRLLIVCSIFFFALLSLSTTLEFTDDGLVFKDSKNDIIDFNDEDENDEDLEEDEVLEIIEEKMEEAFPEDGEFSNELIDEIKQEVKQDTKKELEGGSEWDNFMQGFKDGITNDNSADSTDKTDIIKQDISSEEEPENKEEGEDGPYHTIFKMATGKEKFTAKEIADSAKITNPIVIHGIKQFKRLQDEKSGTQNFSKYFIQHISFMIIFLIPIIALFFKLLYFRRKIIYLDHLVFIIHFHSAVYLILAFGLLLGFFGIALGYFILYIFYFLYRSLKNVYQQGRFKTFFKLYILLNIYTILFAVGLIINLVFSFFLF